MNRCYLAGPMRGIPEFNFPAFYAAAAVLRERGYEVWSPAENDVHEDGFDPTKDVAQPMRHYMKRDLPAVLNADFVAVLPGWENSQGATLEVTVARACGLPVLWAGNLAPVSEIGTTDPLAPAAILAEAEKQEQKPDPIAELCKSIRNDIRLCDHGYIHITCGQCVAPWLRG